jgi:threonine/homoserine/homoserine lactone efflux protein
MINEIVFFLLGYLLVMASPGPTMVAVGSIAAVEGIRSAIAMVLGVALGVGSIASLVLFISDLLQDREIFTTLQFISAMILLLVAWTVARARNAQPSPKEEIPQRKGRGFSLFFSGYATAACNPITIAYFSAMLLPLRHVMVEKGQSGLLVILAVTVAAAFFWLICSTLMSRPIVCRFVHRREVFMRSVAGALIAFAAFSMIIDGIRSLLGAYSLGMR